MNRYLIQIPQNAWYRGQEVYGIKGQIWNNIRKYLSTQSFIKPQGTLPQDAEDIKKINRFHKLLGKFTERKKFYQGTLSRKDEDKIFHLNREDKQRESLHFCFVPTAPLTAVTAPPGTGQCYKDCGLVEHDFPQPQESAFCSASHRLVHMS